MVVVVVVVHRHFISLPWNEAIKKYWAADNSNASHLALLKVENFVKANSRRSQKVCKRQKM